MQRATTREAPRACSRGVRVADFSRVLAGPVRHDDARRLRRRRRSRSSRPPATTPGTGRRPSTRAGRLDLLRQRQPQQALGRARPARRPRASPRRAGSRHRPTSSSRTSARASWRGSGSTSRTCAPSNPGVVYCSITGFGTGDGAALAGYDLLVQAVGGLMIDHRRSPTASPTKVGRRPRRRAHRAERVRRHPARPARARPHRASASSSR